MEMTCDEIQRFLSKLPCEQPTYREALKIRPKDVIYRQFGIQMPEHVNINVLQETADTFYVVLPR